MTDAKTANTSIQVISRMFSLLDVLSLQGEAVSLKSISEQTGLHPSTAHRILNDLAVGGMVERSGPGSYRLGLHLLTLGNLVRARLDVRELCVRPMQELHRLTAQSVSLFVRQDDDALCVARSVADRHGIQITRSMGLRMPLLSNAAGKTLLLNDSNAELHRLAGGPGLRADQLHSEIVLIRQSGIGQDHDSLDPNVQVTAAPVWDDQGRVAATLVVQCPASRLSAEGQDALKASAQRISASLGARTN
jgi:DNA-binding IclR family transcriptional regulator